MTTNRNLVLIFDESGFFKRFCSVFYMVFELVDGIAIADYPSSHFPKMN